jgi:hypothetical protein
LQSIAFRHGLFFFCMSGRLGMSIGVIALGIVQLRFLFLL